MYRCSLDGRFNFTTISEGGTYLDVDRTDWEKGAGFRFFLLVKARNPGVADCDRKAGKCAGNLRPRNFDKATTAEAYRNPRGREHGDFYVTTEENVWQPCGLAYECACLPMIHGVQVEPGLRLTDSVIETSFKFQFRRFYLSLQLYAPRFIYIEMALRAMQVRVAQSLSYLPGDFNFLFFRIPLFALPYLATKE